MIRTNFKIRINTENLIFFSLFLFLILYFFPITITLPGVVRKPLLILGLISFVLALLPNGKYFLMYLSSVCIGLIYYWVSWSVRLSFSSYVFPMLVSIELLICTFMVLDGTLVLSSKIVWLYFAAILITSITSIIGLIQYPIAIRILGQAASDDNAPMQLVFRQYNIAGWGLLFGMGFMEGALIYEYKKRKKIIFLIIAVVDAICVLLSQLAYAIILAAMIIVLVLVNGQDRKFHFRVFLLLIVAIVVWLERQTILSFLYDLAGENDLTMIQLRVKNLYDLLLLKNTAGDAGARFELYMRGIESLINHPLGLFFVDRGEIDGLLGFHSEFFDIIGSLGAFGIVVVAVIVFYFISVINKIKDKYNRRFLLLWLEVLE